jgi:hypothetical protein
MKKIAAFFILVAALLASGPIIAHHGTNAEYDADHKITFKVATVTEFAFANPHIQIYFNVTDDKGKIVHWAVEGPSPGRLIRMGWKRDDVKVGDQVTIVVDPARNGASVGYLNKVIYPNGKELGVVPVLP